MAEGGTEPEDGGRGYGHSAQAVFCVRTRGESGDGRRGAKLADVCDCGSRCDRDGTGWGAGGDRKSDAETRLPKDQSAQRAHHFDGGRGTGADRFSGRTVAASGEAGDGTGRGSEEKRDGHIGGREWRGVHARRVDGKVGGEDGVVGRGSYDELFREDAGGANESGNRPQRAD